MSNEEARTRAEARFQRKKEQIEQSAKAWEEYLSHGRAVAENTARLRALRLAKEAAEGAA